ncbi:hypothetical protein BACPU_17690 [Bacillus pumilus]|nr:hypothetical protein BACPU_17690 [Bacillus pumilus]
MKLNSQWKWAISALIYVAFVLIGYAMYTEFSPNREMPTEQMQNH